MTEDELDQEVERVWGIISESPAMDSKHPRQVSIDYFSGLEYEIAAFKRQIQSELDDEMGL